VLAAIILFLVNSANVWQSAVIEKITDVDLVAQDNMTLPALWICIPTSTSSLLGTRVNMQHHEDPAEIGQAFWVRVLSDDGKDQKVQMQNLTSGTEITTGLELFMKNTYGESNCSYLNASIFVAFPKETHKLAFEFASEVPKDQLFAKADPILVGVLDPVASWAEQTSEFLESVLLVDPFSSTSEMKITMDKMVERAFRFFGMGGEETAKSKYHMTSSTVRRAANNKEGGQSSILYISVGSFVSRVITTRHKPGQELCAELGGIWAISLMLVSAFFKAKSVTGKGKTDPNVEIQVFRLRGASSRTQQLKSMKKMIDDVEEAVEENDPAGAAQTVAAAV